MQAMPACFSLIAAQMPDSPPPTTTTVVRMSAHDTPQAAGNGDGRDVDIRHTH
jgi:hypothetical protein